MRIGYLLIVFALIDTVAFAADEWNDAVENIKSQSKTLTSQATTLRNDLKGLINKTKKAEDLKDNLSAFVQQIEALREIKRNTDKIIAERSLKEIVREIDWLELKSDYEVIKSTFQTLLFDIGDIKGLVETAQLDANSLELIIPYNKISVFFAELASLDEGNLATISLEHAKEKIAGAEFAAEVAEEFAIPKIEAIKLSFGDPHEIYLEDRHGNQFIALRDLLYERAHGIEHPISYESVSEMHCEVKDFELNYGELRLTGQHTCEKEGDCKKNEESDYQTFSFYETEFKRYFFFEELPVEFQQNLIPLTNIDILADRYGSSLLDHCDFDLKNKIQNLELYEEKKGDGDKLVQYLKKVFKGRNFYIKKGQPVDNGCGPLAYKILYTDNKDLRGNFRMVRLLDVELLATQYETSRIADGLYKITDIQSSDIKAFGPSAKLSATIEALKNEGQAPAVTNDNSSNNTGEIKLKLDYTLLNSSPRYESLFPSRLRYAKLGYNLNYKGHLDLVNTTKGTVQDRLLDLYSDNAQNVFFLRFPLLTISQKPKHSNVWDLGVIEIQLYEEKFKLKRIGADAAEETLTHKRRSWGVKIAVLDLQNYGQTNFRAQTGVNIRTNNFAVSMDGRSIETIPSNRVFVFGEISWGNLYPVFVIAGFRRPAGEWDGFWPKFWRGIDLDKSSPKNLLSYPFRDTSVLYFSINYRINPLDVIAITKKVLF